MLKLADSVTDADATLRDYVVTDRLLGNFDEALGLIRSAVEGHASKAAYLHGSFGSGKSHFMAVLHALLRGEAAARGRDELAPLVAKHSVWLDGRKFLLIPYHLLDARSLEQRVLGGYVDRVRALHPDAPIPAVHRTDALLEQAASLREKIGDEQFIAGLPGGDVEDEWGESEAFWTSERAATQAFAGAYADELRRKLVNDLLTSWNEGFFSNAREDAEAFVSLDRGLTEISRHAKELGYDGLILFLDELILWLANSIGDQQFVSREIQKITNFVEGGDTRRPIPVVSFIARQRDLRELVGEEVTGANELSYQDTLNLASGRFDVIKLEDRNLPEIARRRLLKPRDTTAAAAIGKAFDATTKVRREVFDTLLGTDSGSGADIDAFRSTYPFSPAFLSTLVHVSSALQRSRTALKLMRQLLVDRRDTLRLGQLVPLGDLYDVISSGGDQPFTEKLKAEFEMAQKLYDLKLRPLPARPVRPHRRRPGRRPPRATALPAELAGRVRAFTGDDRLVKTLLLAALAPSVPALREPHRPTPLRAQPRQHHQPDPRRRGRPGQPEARRLGRPVRRDPHRRGRRPDRVAGAGRRRRRQRPRHRQALRQRGRPQAHRPAAALAAARRAVERLVLRRGRADLAGQPPQRSSWSTATSATRTTSATRRSTRTTRPAGG